MKDYFKVDFAQEMSKNLKSSQLIDPKIQKLARAVDFLNQAAQLSEEISALGSSKIICRVLCDLAEV